MNNEKENKLRRSAEALCAKMYDKYISNSGKPTVMEMLIDFAKSPEVQEYHKQPPAESDAVEFQNWLFKNRYYETNAFGEHIQTFEHGTIGEPVVKTTQALYTEYLNQKHKTK